MTTKERKEAKLSATDLIDVDLSKMPELEFHVTIELVDGLEKSIKDTREFLSAEIKSNQVKI